VAGRLLALQRSLGNGAVSRLVERMPVRAILRKALRDAGAFRGAVAGKDATDDNDLDAIETALDAYNQIGDDAGQYQERLVRLRALDTLIYGWFRDRPQKSLDAVTGHADLTALLQESEDEHADIIEATKNDDSVLPIDTAGMGTKETKALKKLWRAIVTGTGNLTVEGDPAFQKAMRARLAKILQTDVGRKMLGYLNRPGRDDGDRVRIVAELPLIYRAAEEGRDSDSSYAASTPTLLQGPETPADERFSGHQFAYPRPVTGAADEATMVAMNSPDDLTKAILDGKTGVIMGGQKYAFGAGSGAIVKIIDSHDDKKMAGEDNANEVIDPSFVTLGHELGHAMKMRAGALAQGSSTTSMFEVLEPDANERRLWDNAEELINIQGIENEIRAQSGMHEREYHKPQENVLGLRRKVKLQNRYFASSGRDPMLLDFPEYVDVNARLNATIRANTLHDDTVYGGLKADIEGLDAAVTNEQIKVFKEGKIAERLAEVKDVVSQAKFDDHVVDSDEWQAFETWTNDNWDTLVGVGNDLIRDYLQRATAIKGLLPGIASRQKEAAAKAARKRTARKVKTIAKGIVSFGQWK
jgi:hypothetical protein